MLMVICITQNSISGDSKFLSHYTHAVSVLLYTRININSELSEHSKLKLLSTLVRIRAALSYSNLSRTQFVVNC